MPGLRRRINMFIYENQPVITRLMGWAVFLTSLGTIAFMVYYHGFFHTEDTRKSLLDINRFFFAVFILNFLVRLFFTINRRSFLRSAWLEATLLTLVVLNYASLQLFHFPVIDSLFVSAGFENFEPYSVFFIQCYLLLLILLEAVKSVQKLGSLRIKPTSAFIFSFILLIMAGAFLLSLPAVNTTGQPMRFLDAIFTSASASCVTGLILEDTATFFNTKGQVILLILFQIGGLGIISFATFFATFMRKGVGLKHQSMMKELFDNESLLGTVSLLRKIVFYTISIELISMLLIYNFWGKYAFSSPGQQLFFSAFHAVSAFCNAGFSLVTDGLNNAALQNNYLLHMAIAITIFFGSLGFPAIRDIFEMSNVRERLNKPWKKWKLSTQIAFYSSLVLILFGTILFYLLERQGALADKEMVPSLFISAFQSVTTRTAGFNTIDFSILGAPVLIIMIFLMFVGGSSGSTAGGIKTSTFVVIFSAITATVIGKKEATLGRRTISRELIYKAFSVFVFSASFIFISFVALTIAEPETEPIRLLFEEVAAFTTTGLSTGITPELSDFSKVVLIISMFVGRIGILSLAFSLSVRVNSTAHRYPNSHIMIG